MAAVLNNGDCKRLSREFGARGFSVTWLVAVSQLLLNFILSLRHNWGCHFHFLPSGYRLTVCYHKTAVLDLYGGEKGDGGKLHGYDYYRGNPNQEWLIITKEYNNTSRCM